MIMMNSVILKRETLYHLQSFGLLLWQFFIGQENESGSVEPAMECRAVSCGQKK